MYEKRIIGFEKSFSTLEKLMGGTMGRKRYLNSITKVLDSRKSCRYTTYQLFILTSRFKRRKTIGSVDSILSIAFWWNTLLLYRSGSCDGHPNVWWLKGDRESPWHPIVPCEPPRAGLVASRGQGPRLLQSCHCHSWGGPLPHDPVQHTTTFELQPVEVGRGTWSSLPPPFQQCLAVAHFTHDHLCWPELNHMAKF